MNGYGVPGLPQYLYYQPPPATPYFPFSQLPDSSSSSSQSTPTWFIVAAAVAAVIFCYLFYIFLRKQERKVEHCHEGLSAREASVTARPVDIEEERPAAARGQAPPSRKPPGPEVNPRGGREASWPEDCPTCRHKGGLYHFKYKCAGCSYKNECGIHVQFPSGKQ